MSASLKEIEDHYQDEKAVTLKMTAHDKGLLVDLIENYSWNIGNEGDEYFFEQILKQLHGAKS